MAKPSKPISLKSQPRLLVRKLRRRYGDLLRRILGEWQRVLPALGYFGGLQIYGRSDEFSGGKAPVEECCHEK